MAGKKHGVLLFQTDKGSVFHIHQKTEPPLTFAVCGAAKRTFKVGFLKEEDLPKDAVRCQTCDKMAAKWW